MSTAAKIVLANGVFDLYHFGHVLHLDAVRRIAGPDGIVWVSVTDDSHVHKGHGKPVWPQEMRAAVVKSNRNVDKVITCSSLIEAIDYVHPHVLVKGIDYSDGLHDVHTEYCRKHCIQIVFTKTPKYSAQAMIDDSRKR